MKKKTDIFIIFYYDFQNSGVLFDRPVKSFALTGPHVSVSMGLPVLRTAYFM